MVDPPSSATLLTARSKKTAGNASSSVTVIRRDGGVPRSAFVSAPKASVAVSVASLIESSVTVRVTLALVDPAGKKSSGVLSVRSLAPAASPVRRSGAVIAFPDGASRTAVIVSGASPSVRSRSGPTKAIVGGRSSSRIVTTCCVVAPRAAPVGGRRSISIVSSASWRRSSTTLIVRVVVKLPAVIVASAGATVPSPGRSAVPPIRNGIVTSVAERVDSSIVTVVPSAPSPID